MILINQDIVVWGTGRWANQYISELHSLGFDSKNIHIFGNKLNYKSDIFCRQYSDLNDINFQRILKSSNTSLIVNSNRRHFDSLSIANKYGHNILCEKPLCISNKDLDLQLEISNQNNLKFWESQIPLYSSYLKSLNFYLPSFSSFEIFWQDKKSMSEVRGGFLKKHDLQLDYLYDVLPNILSTLSCINICSTLSPLTLEDLKSSSSDSGEFILSRPSFKVKVFYSRISPKRIRKISASYSKSKSFIFDYSSEEKINVEFKGFSEEIPSFKKGPSALKLQLEDFLSSDSSRPNFSISKSLLLNYPSYNK